MNKRVATLVALSLALVVFFALDLQRFFSFTAIKEGHAFLLARYHEQPILFIAAFMAIHIFALTLCVPGAVLTVAIAGGSLFGTALGTVIVLTSLTIGDSLAFLASRFLIGNWVRRRFSEQLRGVEEEADKNGAFYLLSLRLMAAVPFFVVNLLFGLTRMRLRTFAPVSFIGLIPATALYVHAGTELSKIESPRDVLSPPLIATFMLLSFLPIVARYWFGRRLKASG
jgi:uncharacterized membrane protein YdjX (TVP38/TMEM64 family)